MTLANVLRPPPPCFIAHDEKAKAIAGVHRSENPYHIFDALRTKDQT